MKVKIQVLNKSIEIIEKRLAKIQQLLDYSPHSEIFAVRKEFAELLKNNTTPESRMTSEFYHKVIELEKRESIARKMIEKQKSSIKLIDEKVKLEFELRDLQSELFYSTNNVS